jgi:hypothetical protein
MILGCSETAKTPEWTKAKIIAGNLNSPSAVVSDDKFVYFVTGGHLASLKDGTSGLWKVPVAGGPAVSMVKGFQKDEKTVFLPEKFVVATDEKYVYFSAGSIYRILKDGGEPEFITAGSPTELVLDEENIYWHNFVGEGMKPTPVYSISKKGGEPRAITEPATIIDIAVDNEFFYWAQPEGIFKMPKKGGDKTQVVRPQTGGRIQGMITAQNSILYLDNDTLFLTSKNGENPVKITSGVNYVHKFFADDKNIYFVKNEGSFGTSLNRVARNGGEVSKIDSGYINSFSLGKDKIHLSDAGSVYELEK